jgi:hypothetical protein
MTVITAVDGRHHCFRAVGGEQRRWSSLTVTETAREDAGKGGQGHKGKGEGVAARAARGARVRAMARAVKAKARARARARCAIFSNFSLTHQASCGTLTRDSLTNSSLYCTTWSTQQPRIFFVVETLCLSTLFIRILVPTCTRFEQFSKFIC